MAASKGRKIFVFIFVAAVLTALTYLTFNEYGFIKYFKLKEEIRILENKIKLADEQNRRLIFEIDSLEKKIPQKIERLAREKYGMSRKNESVIKIEVK